jgi:hypothetical protein
MRPWRHRCKWLCGHGLWIFLVSVTTSKRLTHAVNAQVGEAELHSGEAPMRSKGVQDSQPGFGFIR